jgi:hypothetical protein
MSIIGANVDMILNIALVKKREQIKSAASIAKLLNLRSDILILRVIFP